MSKQSQMKTGKIGLGSDCGAHARK